MTTRSSYATRVVAAMDPIVADLRNEAPWEQVIIGLEMLELLKNRYQSAFASIRIAGFRALRKDLSAQAIADTLGVTRSRVIGMCNK
jgi:hypothetical protein